MIWLRFLAPFLPYIISALVMGGAYLWADNGWCNHACDVQKQAASKFREQFAELDRERIRRQEREAQVNAAEEARTKEQDARRKRSFDAARARVDPADRAVPLSDGTRRMLGDAYAAAVAAEAARQPQATSAADSGAPTIADWQKWSVDILEWAAMARDRVQAWERWYQLNSEESYEQIF